MVRASAIDSFDVAAGSPRTCVITGSLEDITTAGFPGSRLIEGGNHVIVRARILDKATGNLLVDAVVRGEVKAAVEMRGFPDALGLARGFRRLLARQMDLEDN